MTHQGRPPLRILLAASEVVGFAKTGGLADVAGSLPLALARRGHDVAVIMPLYNGVRAAARDLAPVGPPFPVPIGGRLVDCHLHRAQVPGSDVPIFFVGQPDYFERDDPHQGRGLYQYATPDGRRHDYDDNAERFIFFSRAVLEALPRLEKPIDILHCNDWQTGLIPCFLREVYSRPGHPHAALHAQVRSLMTIHNIAYQGLFHPGVMGVTGLPFRLFNHRQLEFYGQLNFLKAGCVFADRLSTVSPRYAEEIQTMVFGCGLEGLLTERRDALSGIVNGVDYDVWNPATDPYLAATYDETTVFERKPINKLALQAEYGLPQRPEVPLLGMVARLVEQKGVSLVVQSAHEILNHDVQIVILGEGDPHVHKQLQHIREQHPKQLGLKTGFDESLAHRVEGGVDIFLMPSQFEPSGLNQLYSLRYGSVPVVRDVGGLHDTIVDCLPETLAARTATGFRFGPYTPPSFQQAVHRAVGCYRYQPDVWRQLVVQGMRQDWSWQRSASEYEALFERMVSRNS